MCAYACVRGSGKERGDDNGILQVCVAGGVVTAHDDILTPFYPSWHHPSWPQALPQTSPQACPPRNTGMQTLEFKENTKCL